MLKPKVRHIMKCSICQLLVETGLIDQMGDAPTRKQEKQNVQNVKRAIYCSCRSSRCRHLHPSDLAKMNHSSPMHLWHGMDDLRAGMRAAAFLAAIKRGALFIFQANTGECSSFTLVGIFCHLFTWVSSNYFPWPGIPPYTTSTLLCLEIVSYLKISSLLSGFSTRFQMLAESLSLRGCYVCMSQKLKRDSIINRPSVACFVAMPASMTYCF